MNFYRQNFDGCRTGTIGDQGMTDADFETFLHQAAKGVDWIRQAHSKREWPVLVLPEERRDLDSLADIADLVRDQSKTVIILGMGGSSLGGQTLQGLAALPENGGPHVIFMENLDGHTFTERLRSLDLAKAW